MAGGGGLQSTEGRGCLEGSERPEAGCFGECSRGGITGVVLWVGCLATWVRARQIECYGGIG